ncbi:diacylglycerol/lipid kinase family protein [Anianabacter salinae]|uniref:diacylglycerol/lipid kinase family protein n=1 Tax=Anianabacter salinae TaxID=2851023 RepID=UPI00225E4462|nr:diacylglycerol kinase family protein [Anianabacter salinae]MBV0913873.1 NAD(+)/NADH kinase [Anianabacter salinae]
MSALPDPQPPAVPFRKIVLVANRASGTNRRDRGAIDAAMDVFGDRATRMIWRPGREDMASVVHRAVQGGADLIVAAGGDGTVMAVADAALGADVSMAVLPLGTFNYFSRGLGLSEDPREAAQQILDGAPHDISVGMVNDRVFLNNASLGIYPAILRERETVYRRWGRRRIAAHWSVLKTFLRFQRPMLLEIDVAGETLHRRTALVFIARSTFQLERFGLNGGDAIHDDGFAVLVARAQGRRQLFWLTWRLLRRASEEGEDYELLKASSLTVWRVKRRKALLAFDGEKCIAPSPFEFRMSDRPLRIIVPNGVA